MEKGKTKISTKKESKVYEFTRIPVLKEVKEAQEPTNKVRVLPFYSATKKPKFYPKISTISISKHLKSPKEMSQLHFDDKNVSDTATDTPNQNF